VRREFPGEVRCLIFDVSPSDKKARGKFIGRIWVEDRGLQIVRFNGAYTQGSASHLYFHFDSWRALGHRTDTHFAFSDQVMLADADLLRRLQLGRPSEQIAAAGAKAVEMLSQSPYNAKLANAGLFLKALGSGSAQWPNLIHANLGDQFAGGASLARLESLAAKAPDLQQDKLEQIAALPLGSRIKLDPWNNQIALVKTQPVSLLSARDKLPFEITPFMTLLSRVKTPNEPIKTGFDS
jgi:hypothetical protein